MATADMIDGCVHDGFECISNWWMASPEDKVFE